MECISESEYLNIMTEISNLHMSTNIDEYELLLETTLRRWQSTKDFHQYFKKQWVDSDFNNWQIFKTPAGFNKPSRTIKLSHQKRFHQKT